MYPSKRPTPSPQSYYVPHLSPHKPSKHNLSTSQKYYSQEQVHKLIKSYCQPKLMYLKNQLDQRQLYIQKLNTLLDQNDCRMRRLEGVIEGWGKRERGRGSEANITNMVNQMLNERLRHYWETIQSQVQQKLHKLDEYCKQLHVHLQTRVKSCLQQSKSSITSHIQLMRQKNNSYWLKIKQSLTRLNSKLTKADQSHSLLSLNFTNWKASQQNLSFDVEVNKNVIRKFVQLRKSVGNIYQNYQGLLEMQERFRKRVENRQNQGYGQDQAGNYTDNITNNNHFKQNHPMAFAMLPNKNGKKDAIKQINFEASQDLIDLQYSREQTNFIGVSSMNSPNYMPSITPNKANPLSYQSSNSLLKARTFFQPLQTPPGVTPSPTSPQKPTPFPPHPPLPIPALNLPRLLLPELHHQSPSQLPINLLHQSVIGASEGNDYQCQGEAGGVD